MTKPEHFCCDGEWPWLCYFESPKILRISNNLHLLVGMALAADIQEVWEYIKIKKFKTCSKINSKLNSSDPVMNPLLIFALHRTNPPPPIFSSWNTRLDISYSMPVWLFPWIALSIRKMSWWQMIYYQPVETWYFFKQIEYDPVSSFLATINYEYKIYWRKGVICLFLVTFKISCNLYHWNLYYIVNLKICEWF